MTSGLTHRAPPRFRVPATGRTGSRVLPLPGSPKVGLDEAVLKQVFAPGAVSAAFHQHDTRRLHSMATGTVKWFNEEKRFGFITPDEGGQDLFVHQTGLADGARSLADGAKVTFDAEQGPKAPKAVNVTN